MEKMKWTCVSLSKKQLCFLDEISKNCKFPGGRKLCRTSIVRAFLMAAQKLDIDATGIKSEEELKERVLASFKTKI